MLDCVLITNRSYTIATFAASAPTMISSAAASANVASSSQASTATGFSPAASQAAVDLTHHGLSHAVIGAIAGVGAVRA